MHSLEKPTWKWKKFILFHLTAILLILSFLLPWTKQIWTQIDIVFFQFVNNTLKHESAQIFWAFANHHLADWVEDLFIFGFYLLAIIKTAKGLRAKRIAQFVYCVIYIALIIVVVNRLIFHEILHTRRDSPTLTLENCIRLSDQITWMEVKDDSSKSFPGDHATTALLFAFSYAMFADRRMGMIAIAYAFFLCLPRLVVGAHWLSDIAVGSGSIVLFTLSWLHYSPISEIMVNRLEKTLSSLSRLFKKTWQQIIKT